MTAARPESGGAAASATNNREDEDDSAGVEAQTLAQIVGISLEARNSVLGVED